MEYRVCVIGGGPAGLTAALTAAEQGFRTTLLERGERVGKKLLLTGNGRCNYTNLHIDAGCYHEAENGFAMQALKHFGPQESIAWLRELGIEPTEKNEGWIYPRSEQAGSVLNALRECCMQNGVRIVTAAVIRRIRRRKDAVFQVMTETEMILADRLILATGGKSYSTTGSDGSGYCYATDFGHHLVEPLPALCGLHCAEKEFFRSTAGVRVRGKAELLINGAVKEQAEGEIQLNAYGLSGIPIFQLSRTASIAWKRGKKVEVVVHFLPEIADLGSFLQQRLRLTLLRNLELAGNGLMNKNLWNALLKRAQLKPGASLEHLGREEISNLQETLEAQRFRVLRTADFEQAQVTTGGIDTGEIDPETMESRLVPGLRFAGEIMNVDGICGGYNLQWCWTSGKLAGGRT
jgi:hypothetical protein